MSAQSEIKPLYFHIRPFPENGRLPLAENLQNWVMLLEALFPFPHLVSVVQDAHGSGSSLHLPEMPRS